MKIYPFILLIISLSVFSAEEVFYCSDTDAVGFEPNESYKKESFEGSRFVINVDFENESIISEEVGFPDLLILPTLCDNQGKMMVCYNTFSHSTIKILLPEKKFVRTFIFGTSDSIYITHGECEKF